MSRSVVWEWKLGHGSGLGVAHGFRRSSEAVRERKRKLCMGQNERRERPIESYLRGLTEHLGDLEKCLRELGREREELEWEGRALDLGLKANEEEREWALGYIEEIPRLRVPRLRDRALRSLVRHAKDLGS
jgi:hypothetical protein